MGSKIGSTPEVHSLPLIRCREARTSLLRYWAAEESFVGQNAAQSGSQIPPLFARMEDMELIVTMALNESCYAC